MDASAEERAGAESSTTAKSNAIAKPVGEPNGNAKFNANAVTRSGAKPNDVANVTTDANADTLPVGISRTDTRPSTNAIPRSVGKPNGDASHGRVSSTGSEPNAYLSATANADADAATNTGIHAAHGTDAGGGTATDSVNPRIADASTGTTSRSVRYCWHCYANAYAIPDSAAHVSKPSISSRTPAKTSKE